MSSSSEIMKNNRQICGRNTIVALTPPMTPSVMHSLMSPGGSSVEPDLLRQPRARALDEVHRVRREREDGVEDRIMYRGEREETQHRVREDAVEAVGEAVLVADLLIDAAVRAASAQPSSPFH